MQHCNIATLSCLLTSLIIPFISSLKLSLLTLGLPRTLFIHHYLPAYIFKLMLTAFTVSHLAHLLRRLLPPRIVTLLCTAATLVWLTAVVYVFYRWEIVSNLEK